MPPVAPKALRNRSDEHILELVLELANDQRPVQAFCRPDAVAPVTTA
jgi:hypothetical protein